MQLLYTSEPHIVWDPRFNPLLRAQCYDLAEVHRVQVVGLLKLTRAIVMERLQEDDWYDFRIAEGEWRSLGGTALDYDLDLGEAKALFHRDMWYLSEHTGPGDSLAEAVRNLQTSVGWMWFWAIRSPSLAQRGEWQLRAEDGEARLRRQLQRIPQGHVVLEARAAIGRGKEVL